MAHSVETQRTRLLVQIEQLLEKPMIVLSFIWVALVVIELTTGVTRAGQIAGYCIWGAFVVDFLIKFIIAPRKTPFLRRNVVTVLSLLLPALRVLRIARVLRFARVARGMRFARLLGTWNRGMRALRRSMRRHGFGYVLMLTLMVLFSGAAGMMAFERDGGSGRFDTYGAALWWTAVVMTTTGPEHWPGTASGRALMLVLAIYSFGVFGYITATLASFFIDRDREEGLRP